MSPLEVLTKARELIADPANWTTGLYARNAQGEHTMTTSKDAVCWCSEGAVFRVTPENWEDAKSALQLINSVAGDDIVGFNDSHTHAEVMEVWDKALELAKA